jgi:hypothetical protein
LNESLPEVDHALRNVNAEVSGALDYATASAEYSRLDSAEIPAATEVVFQFDP